MFSVYQCYHLHFFTAVLLSWCPATLLFLCYQGGGSTNTLGALAWALGDEGTQAVYLLTDGRPDQVFILRWDQSLGIIYILIAQISQVGLFGKGNRTLTVNEYAYLYA